MEQLTQLIFRHAQPKRLNNTVITGPMLASLAEAYVEAINTGAVPTIATAWQVRQHTSLLANCAPWLRCGCHSQSVVCINSRSISWAAMWKPEGLV